MQAVKKDVKDVGCCGDVRRGASHDLYTQKQPAVNIAQLNNMLRMIMVPYKNETN
jgi:hypothetical protein